MYSIKDVVKSVILVVIMFLIVSCNNMTSNTKVNKTISNEEMINNESEYKLSSDSSDFEKCDGQTWI